MHIFKLAHPQEDQLGTCAMCMRTETRLREHTPRLPSNAHLHFAAENTDVNKRGAEAKARHAGLPTSLCRGHTAESAQRMLTGRAHLCRPGGSGHWLHRNHTGLPSDRYVKSTHMFLLLFTWKHTHQPMLVILNAPQRGRHPHASPWPQSPPAAGTESAC